MENEKNENGSNGSVEYKNFENFGKVSATQMIFDDGGSILQYSVDTFELDKDTKKYDKVRHKINIKADDLDAWKAYNNKIVEEAKKELATSAK